jgi:hypothetical protein
MALTYPINNHKFFRMYNSLSVKEMKEFIDFCNIKFISGGRDYSIILDNIENLKTELRTRSLWNRLSELTRILEDFFLLKNIRGDKEERNVKLLEILNTRNISDIVEAQFKHTIKIIEKQKISDQTFYRLQRTHLVFSTHLIQNNKYIKFVKHFRKQSEYAIAYFLTEIFSIQTDFDQQKQENIWHDYLANEMLINSMDTELIISSLQENIPDIYMHVKYTYLLYKAFNDPDKKEYFFESKKIFDELRPDLNVNLLTMAYQSFINYCINRTNNFDSSFNRVLFDIYNEKLALGIDDDIRKRNYPTNNFRDYVIVGLRLNEFEWVDNFIAKYGEVLPEDYKPDEVNICRAMLYLAKNEYDNALKIVEKTRRRNYLHYIDTSDIKLRIYYIKNDMINAYEEIERLDKYLKTNEAIPRQRRYSFELFVKNYKRLLRLQENFSQDRLAKAELYLKKSPRFFRKAWLEERIKAFA